MDKYMEAIKTNNTLMFTTGNNNRYIYDGITNCVFATDDIINECINVYNTYSIKEAEQKVIEKYGKTDKVISAITFVEKMITQKHAFYKDEEWIRNEKKYMYDFNEDDVKTCLYTLCSMEQMVLSVTEDCNLRCKYCFFSDEYKNTRNRTHKMMTDDIAIKSLDFFFERMKIIRKRHPGKIAAITFYGGEPLLNFRLIKKCVQYIKNNYSYKCELSITTNGILLNTEVAKFLHDNNFNISISLDGSKNNHNRNRVTSTGEGSFDIVYNNIRSFQTKYPDYDKIKLISVYDYSTDIMENNRFFSKEKLPFWISITSVLQKDTEYYKKFNQESIELFAKNYGEAIKRYLNHKSDGIISTEYSDCMVEKTIVGALTRCGADDKKIPFMPYTSTCIPGTKIHVSTEGEFYICEKMDCDKSIGSYKEGLNYTKIVDIIKNYNSSVSKNCYKCPIYRVCPYCMATTGTQKGFEIGDCNEMINLFIMQLCITFTALENNPNCFEHFADRYDWGLDF